MSKNIFWRVLLYMDYVKLIQIDTCLIHVAFDAFETDSAEFNA